MTSRACFGRSVARFLGGLLCRLSWHRLFWRRTGRSLRRELWALEDALATDAPKLASMFEIFNSLTRYERPVGIEPLASSAPLLTVTPPAKLMSRALPGGRSPRRTRLAAIATLATLVLVLAACLALSARIHPATRSCLVATSAGLTGFRLSRGGGCTAYPANK